MEVAADSKGPSARERRWVGRIVRTFWLRNRRGRDWPVPAWLPHETLRIAGGSGARLAARWFPAPKARGTVVLAHPDRRYGQHWFIITGWIDFLHDHRYNVLTFDFPAYGATQGGSTYFADDVVAAAGWARERAPAQPLHVVGLSQGAFAVANAAPHLEFVESLVLESPYPSIAAWYGNRLARWPVALMDRLFPRSARVLRADENLSRAKARRILVVASPDDRLTPKQLSEAVVHAGPPDRTRFLEVVGAEHLELFSTSAEYRDAILQTFEGPTAAVARPRTARRRQGRAARSRGTSLSPAFTPARR